MSQYGHTYPAHMYPPPAQPQSAPPAAYSPQQMQHAQSASSMPRAYHQPYKGTLAPGTRVKVGSITVTVKRYLSEGGFAHVYLVTTLQPIPMPVSVTGRVAGSVVERGETVHVLKRIAVPDKAALADVRREVEVHKLLRNQPNIVHFIEASATALQAGGYEIFILMEYCSGGGIISLMNARLRDRLREQEVLKIFGDVCAAVAVMHHLDPPLMHRDLKVENILMAPSTHPGVIPGSRSTSSNLKATFKLCDFGSAAPVLSRNPPKSMDDVKSVEADLNKHTTLQYRAPEMVDVYQRRVIDEKADIWALGVLLYKLCYYTTPFEENGGGPLAILNVQYRIPTQPVYSDRVKHLIHSMLKEHSAERPTIDQLVVDVHHILATPPPQHGTQFGSVGGAHNIPRSVRGVGGGGVKPDSGSGVCLLKESQKAIGRIDANLISIGPSSNQLELAQARELELQKQTITPMRRGRPIKPPRANTDADVNQLCEDSVNNTSPASTSPEAPPPHKSTRVWNVADSNPSASVQTGGLIDGFGDSFSPVGISAETPPSLPKRPSPVASSPLPNGEVVANVSDAFVHNNLLRASCSNIPSPTISPLRHSPALPGFSLAPTPTASPLPTTTKPTPKPTPKPALLPKPATPRDELTDRFPTLEDLDARYTSPTPSCVPSTTSSGAGTHVNVPALSNRASVGAIAGRFERPFERQRHSVRSTSGGKSAEAGGSNRWQSSVMAYDRVANQPDALLSRGVVKRKSVGLRDWLTGNGSDDDLAGEVEAENDGKGLAHKVEMEVEEASSDEDEVVRPEEAVAQRPMLPLRLSVDRLSSFASHPGCSEPMLKDQVVNGKPDRPRIVPGRVKPPSWLVDAVDSPTAAERLMNPSSMHTQLKSAAIPSLVSPITDATAAEQMDEAARNAQHQLEALLRGPADSPDRDATRSVSPAAKAKVAPAWDEDDEDAGEMNALPKPDLQAGLVQTGVWRSGSMQDPIAVEKADSVDSEVQSNPIASRWDNASDKQLVDVATSPAAPTTPLESVESRLDGLCFDAGSNDRFCSNGGKESVGTVRPLSIVAQRQAQLQPSNPPEPIVLQPKRPTPIRPAKGAHLRGSSLANGMKPWEREAAISAAAVKGGITRSSALPAASSLLHRESESQQAEAEGEAKAGEEEEEEEEEEDGFSGVSSLISRWQQNVESNAPGWGKIGGANRMRANSSK